MPTYEYVCDACQARVEHFQSIKDAPKRKCPKCGRLKLVRQIGSGAGVLFKGSGFYQTDYRSAAYRKSESAEKGPAPGAACTGDKKSCAANGGPCAAQ